LKIFTKHQLTDDDSGHFCAVCQLPKGRSKERKRKHFSMQTQFETGEKQTQTVGFWVASAIVEPKTTFMKTQTTAKCEKLNFKVAYSTLAAFLSFFAHVCNIIAVFRDTYKKDKTQ
jgi:hypothetical protein